MNFHEQTEGWTVEYPSKDLAVICRPQELGAGFVTIDFKRRVFAGGYGYPYQAASTKKYEGRGWKQEIVDDAVAWLEKAMK